jgi:hypothetical protein
MPDLLPPPRNWAAQVQPAGTDGWEQTAVAWLLGLLPDLPAVSRRDPAPGRVRRHCAARDPRPAGAHPRHAYRIARTELAEQLPPHAVDAVLLAYREEGRRLVATERAVQLVERSLRG